MYGKHEYRLAGEIGTNNMWSYPVVDFNTELKDVFVMTKEYRYTLPLIATWDT